MTQLDKKRELIQKIERLSSADDIQKVKIFISGLEAGKSIKQTEHKEKPP